MHASSSIDVLCVDDDPQFADLTAMYLEQNDSQFSAITAAGAQEGLEEMDARDIDCIISDYDMPGMNGIEFLKTIRAVYSDLPFLLFTGRGSEEVASDAISAGVSDYMRKSGKLEQHLLLAQRVENLVSQYQTSRLLQDTINTVNASIFVVDSEDKYLLMNEQARDLLEIGDEEVVGKTNEELFSEELATQFQANNREVLETGSAVEVQQEVATTHGHKTYMTRINPLFDEDGEVYACCGIATETVKEE